MSGIGNWWRGRTRKMTRLYLAGPMRSRPLFGFQAFEDARATLAGVDITVVSPHDMDIADKTVNIEYSTRKMENGVYRREFTKVEWLGEFKSTMRKDFVELLKCDGIVLLPGWKESEGARYEQTVAAVSGLDVYEYWEGVAVLVDDPFPYYFGEHLVGYNEADKLYYGAF